MLCVCNMFVHSNHVECLGLQGKCSPISRRSKNFCSHHIPHHVAPKAQWLQAMPARGCTSEGHPGTDLITFVILPSWARNTLREPCFIFTACRDMSCFPL